MNKFKKAETAQLLPKAEVHLTPSAILFTEGLSLANNFICNVVLKFLPVKKKNLT